MGKPCIINALKTRGNKSKSKGDPILHNIIRGEPEQAPNTRGTGSGFICIYVCGGDHFNERVKF